MAKLFVCPISALDGEELDQNLEDLINDDPIEDDDDNSESGNISGEEEKVQSDVDEDLDDEDYELLEENTGTKIDRVSLCLCRAKI